jgi:hypothetical protein
LKEAALSDSAADSQDAEPQNPDRFEQLMKAMEGRLSQQIAAVQEQITTVQEQIATLQEDVQALRGDSDRHDRELGLLSVQASIDRERATRAAGRGDYREVPRRSQVPSPTEPAVSGFSFDPSIRKPATPRYG